jgi:hypothetical protein
MMFSSSMSVVEYYLLHRFPVPYGNIFLPNVLNGCYIICQLWTQLVCLVFLAAYFIAVAFIAAIISQHYVRKLISWLGRASLIIFILASMIFISAISLDTIFLC